MRTGQVGSTYLYSGFGQTGLGSQPFASAHARIMALVELLFQFVELVRAERGPVAPELGLLGTAATAHALHVVFATVNGAGSVACTDLQETVKINTKK